LVVQRFDLANQLVVNMDQFNSQFSFLERLIYGKSTVRFEDKVLLFTTLAISVILIISTIFNISFGLKGAIVVSTAIGIFVYLGLFLFGRLYTRGALYSWIVSFTSLGYADILWFINYGSAGPVFPLFVVLFAFLILVFSKRYLIWISLLLVVNLVVLFLFELNFPDAIGFYPDNKTRLYDVYIGLIFSLMIIFAFITTIKKNYIREYERAKMSDRLKSAFVANLSHEIRTPLNAIVGFSSLISEADVQESERKLYEDQIARNSDYLLNLIEDIIDVSKIESNQLNVKIEPVDIVPVISRVVQSFRLTIPADKKVNVVAECHKEKMIIRVDQLRFEQILRNLLSNAVKFTDEGSIEVSCEKKNDYYTFAVKDTGIGIHIEHQKIIFDRFMKIDNSKQHLYRGTGIGLFLSKQLVEMFGGKIWVESEVGKGSVFYFTIPV
jgi:signal transduction histidine kinase